MKSGIFVSIAVGITLFFGLITIFYSQISNFFWRIRIGILARKIFMFLNKNSGKPYNVKDLITQFKSNESDIYTIIYVVITSKKLRNLVNIHYVILKNLDVILWNGHLNSIEALTFIRKNNLKTEDILS